MRTAAGTGAGTSTLASRWAASCIKPQPVGSSSRRRRCSLMAADGPGAWPLGRQQKLWACGQQRARSASSNLAATLGLAAESLEACPTRMPSTHDDHPRLHAPRATKNTFSFEAEITVHQDAYWGTLCLHCAQVITVCVRPHKTAQSCVAKRAIQAKQRRHTRCSVSKALLS